MNSFLIVFLFALAALAQGRPQEKYTNKFDDVDLKEILANRRLLLPYINCTLDTGRCTPDGKELKSHIREALENNCGKCTKKQADGVNQVIGHLINHEEDHWKQLTAKYDPQHKYTKKYEDRLRTVASKH